MDIIGIERQAQDMILGKEIQMSLMLWASFLAPGYFSRVGVSEEA